MNGNGRLLLDYEAAAHALSLTRAALRDLVYKGRGPTVTKIGRRTFFAVADLQDFIDAHREKDQRVLSPEPLAERRGRGRPTIAQKRARDAVFARPL
jgi:hypothetical protein